MFNAANLHPWELGQRDLKCPLSILPQHSGTAGSAAGATLSLPAPSDHHPELTDTPAIRIPHIHEYEKSLNPWSERSQQEMLIIS